MKDVNKTEHEDPDHVESEGDEEHEEVPVVPPPDAVVDPGAVMVKYLDAVVTHTAVATPRGSVELTGHTPFHSDRDSVDLYIPVERRPEVIVPVFVGTCPGYHARVHEGRHGEVDEDEQGDNPLEDGHSIPMLYHNIPLDTREVEKQRCGPQQKKPCKRGGEKFCFGFTSWHLVSENLTYPNLDSSPPRKSLFTLVLISTFLVSGIQQVIRIN